MSPPLLPISLRFLLYIFSCRRSVWVSSSLFLINGFSADSCDFYVPVRGAELRVYSAILADLQWLYILFLDFPFDSSLNLMILKLIFESRLFFVLVPPTVRALLSHFVVFATPPHGS